MKQICMYCEEDLGVVEETPDETDLISHGLCHNCFPKFVARKGQALSDFLDSLPGPIFVVDDDVRVIGTNTQGLKCVSKDLDATQGRLGGEVFECNYARLPDGCGHTIHCKTCSVRISVTKTAETGEPCIRIPAYMDLGDISGDKTIRFLISTEKVNDVILLRIDDVQSEEQHEYSSN